MRFLPYLKEGVSARKNGELVDKYIELIHSDLDEALESECVYLAKIIWMWGKSEIKEFSTIDLRDKYLSSLEDNIRSATLYQKSKRIHDQEVRESEIPYKDPCDYSDYEMDVYL